MKHPLTELKEKLIEKYGEPQAAVKLYKVIGAGPLIEVDADEYSKALCECIKLEFVPRMAGIPMTGFRHYSGATYLCLPEYVAPITEEARMEIYNKGYDDAVTQETLNREMLQDDK